MSSAFLGILVRVSFIFLSSRSSRVGSGTSQDDRKGSHRGCGVASNPGDNPRVGCTSVVSNRTMTYRMTRQTIKVRCSDSSLAGQSILGGYIGTQDGESAFNRPRGIGTRDLGTSRVEKIQWKLSPQNHI